MLLRAVESNDNMMLCPAGSCLTLMNYCCLSPHKPPQGTENKGNIFEGGNISFLAQAKNPFTFMQITA